MVNFTLRSIDEYVHCYLLSSERHEVVFYDYMGKTIGEMLFDYCGSFCDPF